MNSLVRDIGHRCELAGATRTRINSLELVKEKVRKAFIKIGKN